MDWLPGNTGKASSGLGWMHTHGSMSWDRFSTLVVPSVCPTAGWLNCQVCKRDVKKRGLLLVLFFELGWLAFVLVQFQESSKHFRCCSLNDGISIFHSINHPIQQVCP